MIFNKLFKQNLKFLKTILMNFNQATNNRMTNYILLIPVLKKEMTNIPNYIDYLLIIINKY